MASRTARRYTLIAACDIDGFVIEACQTVLREQGVDVQDPTRGTVDGERFLLWVKEKLVPVLGNYGQREPRSVVVLDNATVHHVEGIVEAIEEAGAKVVYTAAYAPEYNPIETMFHLYKGQLRRHQTKLWIDAHALALRTVTPAKARALYRHAQVPGCEHLGYDKEDDEEEILCAVAAVLTITEVFQND